MRDCWLRFEIMAAEKEDLRILDISNLSFEDSIRVEKLVAQLNEACKTSFSLDLRQNRVTLDLKL